jgi:hypothetical protein
MKVTINSQDAVKIGKESLAKKTEQPKPQDKPKDK